MCASFGATEEPVEVAGGDVGAIQSSGLAAARTRDDLFYTHDDAGGEAKLYLFTADGEWLGAQTISGATNTDWEDVAPGPCPAGVDGESCLWIADIGDNEEVRPYVSIWVLAETTQASQAAIECRLVYPKGEPEDAEAMWVAPDGSLRIATKHNDHTRIYRLDSPDCDGGEETLVEEAEVSLDEPVTGASMNEDGTAVVMRGLTRAWMWTGCTFAWSETPLEIDLGSQPQGEAVAFTADGALVTTSEVLESENLRYWRTPCASTEALDCPGCGCGDGGAAWVLMGLGLWRRRR